MNLKDKIIAFDIDGTIANNTHCPSIYTIDKINELVKQGYTIILSTGRGAPTSKKIYDDFNLNSYCVFCNGALVYNPSTKEILKGKPIPKSVVKKVLTNNELLNMFAEISFLGKETIYCLNNTITYIETQPVDIKEILNQDIYNIDIILKNKDDQKRVQSIIGTFNPNYSYFYWVFAGEIRSNKIDKVDGLKEVLKYYHKTSKDLIYFGDNQIDIHSLRFAKYSIAMANSNEEVKSNAKQITKLTNDEDGAIKHLLEMIEN